MFGRDADLRTGWRIVRIPDNAKPDMVNRIAGATSTAEDLVDKDRYMGPFIALHYPVRTKLRVTELGNRPSTLIFLIGGKPAGQRPFPD